MPGERTVRDALLDALEDLDSLHFKKFCHAIRDRREEPRVKWSSLEGKDPLDVTGLLVTTFTESGAIGVVLETLERIHCNAERESLAKDCEALLSCVARNASLKSVSRYGDIMKVETSGASWKTAQQDLLKYSGVKASHAMAETDLADMNNFKSAIQQAAQQRGVDAALIAALISRSCRAGRILSDGEGCSNTFGLMQIDVASHGGRHKLKGSWDSPEHIGQATDILLYFIVRMKNEFPDWTKEQQLKGGIAAYNSGEKNIHSYEEVDAKTTNGDYSNDVVARAQWYKSEGGF